MAPATVRIPESSSSEDLAEKLTTSKKQLHRACDQVVVLNRKLYAISSRYRLAKKNNMRTFRYPLRLRLAVAEGIRNMFFDYAVMKAEEVKQLRRHLTTEDDNVYDFFYAETKLRYRMAKKNNMRTFRYPLRLRLAVAEGIRNMFYDYAVMKAEEVKQLRRHLTTEDDNVDDFFYA